MSRYSRFLLVLISVIAFGCKKGETVIPVSEVIPLTKITSIDSDKSFVDADGKKMFPWGLNYTNPQIIGLIEDQWDQESTWQIITEDFMEMKSYSANIVRIHLQYHQFMIDESTPNQQALQRLNRLVKIAEETGLYLDITGLAAYRKNDAPAWYDALSDGDRWATHAVFWKNIAATVGDSKAVFAYNLMNEPVVSVDCDGVTPCEWLPKDGFGGFHFIQNISRDPDLMFHSAMKDWIGMLTSAIRSEDSSTLITVGFLALGSVTTFEEDLDYLSIHLYPKSGELQLAVAKILNNQSSKPLVLEETSNLECSIEELQTFLDQIEGNYHGLMGHYFGKTVEEMQNSESVADALHKDFIEFFSANNPN